MHLSDRFTKQMLKLVFWFSLKLMGGVLVASGGVFVADGSFFEMEWPCGTLLNVLGKGLNV